MSSTLQIKRSTANAAPGTLKAGELAVSYLSNVIFIGDTANGVMNVGGVYYTQLLDNASAANGSTTVVRRYSNGSAQFSQLDILVEPTSNTHVATKAYVDSQLITNISLNTLSDVIIVGANTAQNNKILIGHANGQYISTDVSGNVTISNTGVVTIGAGQITNSMLANAKIGVEAGAGLASNLAAAALGETMRLDVIAGDGISNTGDAIAVDSTVVRTSGNQTINGQKTFNDTITIDDSLYVTGNIYLNGNTTYINVNTFAVTDSLLYLASNNEISDTIDIGFIGGKNTAGQYSHTGLVRHALDGKWYLFDNLLDEGHQNNVVDIANTTYALLRANIDAQAMNAYTLGVSQTLHVTGNTTLSSNLSVSKNVSIGQNLTVTGTANFGSLSLDSALPVGSGGLGVSSLTTNGVLFGSNSTTVGFATGTEGQILQIASGVPAFAMLDGGSF